MSYLNLQNVIKEFRFMPQHSRSFSKSFGTLLRKLTSNEFEVERRNHINDLGQLVLLLLDSKFSTFQTSFFFFDRNDKEGSKESSPNKHFLLL